MRETETLYDPNTALANAFATLQPNTPPLPTMSLRLFTPLIALALTSCAPAVHQQAMDPALPERIGDGGNIERRDTNDRAPQVEPPAGQVCRDDPRVHACIVHRVPGDRSALALATGHGSLALAYIPLMNSPRGPEATAGATLILHDRELRPIGESRLVAKGALRDISLIGTPDGWMAALAIDNRIEIVRLDIEGREYGYRSTIADASLPRLSADPPRPPLLAWSRPSDGSFAARVIVDIGSPPRPTTIFNSTTEPQFGGQIAIAPGEFLLARRSSDGVVIRQLSAKGELGSRHADVGADTEYPTLVRCDDGPRLIWSEFGGRGEVRWARLRDDGEVIGEMIRLSGIPTHFNHSPAVCDGTETLVLLSGYTGGTGLSKSLDLVRVDNTGEIISDLLPLHGDSGRMAHRPTMLRDHDALFIAWATWNQPVRVALARVDLESTGGPAIAR